MIRDPAQLEASVQRHEEEWREAVAQLREAMKRPLGLAERIRDDPLPWLAGGLVVGLWVGIRRD